ncbi:MAG: hypothetical protein CV082_14385 [Candidatus Brocadia sp. BL1]|nr:MAG: hypothetical protein CV082_14385 [Candidatus Brocadia sp. BL1]
MESFCYRTYPSFIISASICPVENVGKDKIAEGESIENIIQDYPSLTPDDVKAAVHYAAKLCEYEAYAR